METKLVFIIPTVGRYEELNTLLDSITSQTHKPDLVIIIDSGKKYAKDKINVNYCVHIEYIHTNSNSLTKSRNIGIKNVPKDFNLIGFLDDDVVLLQNSLKNMLDFWKMAPPEIGGAAFNIIDNRKPRKFWIFKKVFFMGDRYPGNVLKSGYQTMLYGVKKNIFTKWLPGGATVWRREVFDYFKFDEVLKGYGYIEDLEFSYRVSKRFKLIVLEGAKVLHSPYPKKRKGENINFGISEVKNRYYFVAKHKEFSKFLFYWALLGKLLENIITGLLLAKCDYLERAWGNFLGIGKLLERR